MLTEITTKHQKMNSKPHRRGSVSNTQSVLPVCFHSVVDNINDIGYTGTPRFVGKILQRDRKGDSRSGLKQRRNARTFCFEWPAYHGRAL
jgi:hypothetical protein